jgi:HAD superfamily phosphoserine phosphatase-like hydrolase
MLSIKFFIDFDGTITREDVGDAMFERFGGIQCREYINRYRRGEISAAECFRLECGACNNVDKNELDAFLDTREIDRSFLSFINFCRSEHFEPIIVSDGMDYYINRILSKNKMSVILSGDAERPAENLLSSSESENEIDGLRIFSNKLQLVSPLSPLWREGQGVSGSNGDAKVSFSPSFPFENESCDRCACCKRNIMLTESGDDDICVLIGEGYSDRCPAPYADLVFAKDDLKTFCIEEGIPFDEYASFSDIERRMRELLEVHRTKPGKSRLHQRRRAVLARRNVFIGE